MNKYQETFNTWNKIAKIYEDKFMDLKLYNESYNYLLHQINKRDAKILEIGCGPGNITKYLLNENSSYQIKGIDIAPNMIALAKKNNPTAEFEVMDIRDVDTIKERFDAIVCGFCLPYLSKTDCLKLFKDASNLLNDKGLLYLSFVEGDYNASKFISGSTSDRTYFYYHEIDFITDRLKQNSFELLKEFKVTYPNHKGHTEMHSLLIGRNIN